VIDRTVSHYRITQKIGGGGMGIVYRATDTKLNRPVALKFLAPELTRDDKAKRRFLHEAQAASALDHPNICPVYEIDETPEGGLFIAMPLLDGESVRDRVAHGPLSVQEAFEIAFAVVQGLSHAHAAGIVHRDIKPANVVITGDGYVKIVDFGLAKLLGRSRLTASDVTMGTVAYMSPEQAGNDEVDHRADIWSVGVMLYEMLAGRLPFRGQIDQAMVYSILNEEPPPLAQARKEVPRECAAIVERCLQKDPDRRYASAAALAEAIVAAARKLGWDTSMGSGSISGVARVRPPRRTRLPVRAVAATLAVAIAAVAVYQLKLRREPAVFTTKVRIAVLPIERVGEAPSREFVDGLSAEVFRLSDAAARELRSTWVLPYERVLADPPALPSAAADAFGVSRVITGDVQPFGDRHRLTLVLRDARSTTAELRREHVVFDETSAGLSGALANAVLMLVGAPTVASRADTVWPGNTYVAYLEGTGLLTRARTVADAERADALFANAQRGEKDATVLEARARALRQAGSLADALDLADAAVAADMKSARALATRAAILADMGDAEGAVAAYEMALRADRRNVDAQQSLAGLLSSLDRFDEAEVCYRRLLAQRPDYAEGRRLFGRLYRDAGRPDEAEAQYDTALALAPKDWRTLTNMGALHHAQGNWKTAREYMDGAYVVKPTCYTCNNVGAMLYFEHKFLQSAQYYRLAFEYCDSSDYEIWGNWAGSLYWAEGREAAARETYGRAIVLAEAELTSRPDDAMVMAHLADYYAMAGEDSAAMAMVARLGDRARDDVMVVFNLACVHAKLGDMEQALRDTWDAVQQGYPFVGIEREPLFREMVRDDRFRRMFEDRMAGHAAQPQ